MVDMGVGEQHENRRESLLLDKLHQLRILEGSLAGGVNDGALPRLLVVDDVAVDLEMIECELPYHKGYGLGVMGYGRYSGS